MEKNKLLKSYPTWAKKIRRIWVNLLRSYPGTIWVITPMSYIMILLFLISLITGTKILFIIGVAFIIISMIYFRLYPLTWEEMDSKEKRIYKDLHHLPKNWKP